MPYFLICDLIKIIFSSRNALSESQNWVLFVHKSCIVCLILIWGNIKCVSVLNESNCKNDKICHLITLFNDFHIIYGFERRVEFIPNFGNIIFVCDRRYYSWARIFDNSSACSTNWSILCYHIVFWAIKSVADEWKVRKY